MIALLYLLRSQIHIKFISYTAGQQIQVSPSNIKTKIMAL